MEVLKEAGHKFIEIIKPAGLWFKKFEPIGTMTSSMVIERENQDISLLMPKSGHWKVELMIFEYSFYFEEYSVIV
jgi:hypothetical protein